MQYNTLGKTGLKVSRIGLGGIPVQRIDAAQTHKLLQYLCEEGVNFIDTARGYTVSEEYLGEALEGMRDKFIIATKSMSRSYEDMARDIEISLNNLKTDYIDLYQLHNIKTDADFELAFSDKGAVAAIKDAIKDGKIGHLGATAHGKDAFERLLNYDEIETVMFPYNIVESQGEELMEKAAAQNVGFIAMKPLAGGNITNGRLALHYVLANKNCGIAIPGMADIKEAMNNLDGAKETEFKQEDLDEIAAIRKRLAGDFCRRCGYCAPCTVGIDIPGVFVLQGYLENYDLEGWARARYATQKAKASACIGCGKCEERCPYNLPIRKKLEKIKELFE